MKTSMRVRFFVTLLLASSMLMPVSALAFYDGKKHFSEGIKFEVSEQWDKAAEEFALAVSENPKNPEYRLHLTRALFNASQMFIKKGTLAAKEADYEGAYLAFKRAYAFDPTNELAKSEMDRMVRLQKAATEGTPDKKRKPDGRKHDADELFGEGRGLGLDAAASAEARKAARPAVCSGRRP